ncbi:MAG: hypothetical protein PHT77_12650 [Bacteroidales bacterium]|nr:hypothetical protein [Bacteroidales bacterium]
MQEFIGFAKPLMDLIRNIFSDVRIRKSKESDIVSEIAVNVGILSEFTRNKKQKCDREIATKVIMALKHEAYDKYRSQNLNLKRSFSELIDDVPAKPIHLEIAKFYRKIFMLEIVISSLEDTGIKPNYRLRLKNLQEIGVGIIKQINRSVKKKKEKKK